jgi:hypothetical protein
MLWGPLCFLHIIPHTVAKKALPTPSTTPRPSEETAFDGDYASTIPTS